MKAKFVLSTLWVALALTTYSCKEDADLSSSVESRIVNNEELEAEMELSADLDTDLGIEVDSSLEDELRGIQYTVSNGGKSIKLRLSDEDREGFVVLKRINGGSTVSKVTWKRIKNKSAVAAKGTISVPTGNGKLYMMGIIGGTYDSNQKRVSFQTPTEVTEGRLVNGARVLDFDMPYTSKWQEVEVKTVNKVKYVLLKKATGSTIDATMSMSPRGFILAISLTNKMNQALVNLNEFKLQSNQIRNAGYFDLSEEAEANQFSSWNYTDANSLQISRYRYTAPSIPSNTSLPLRYTWAIAEEKTVSAPLTRVLVDITLEKSNLRYKANPTFLRTVVNGNTRHTESSVTFKNGKNYLFVPEVRRPKLSLEYVADYNIGSTSGVFANTHSNSITETNSTRLYTATEAKNMSLPQGYILPTKNQMRGIIPQFQVGQGSTPILRGVVYGDATQESKTTNQREAVAIEGDANTYTSDYYATRYTGNGVRIAYGLRFKGNENLLLSAWRYEYRATNPSGRGGGILEVRARYIGASSNTITINSISNENYWGIGTNTAAGDIVRYFSLNGASLNGTHRYKYSSSTNDDYEGYYWATDSDFMDITGIAAMLSNRKMSDASARMAIRPFLIE